MRERLRGTFRALAIYNYRVFWLGQLVSLSGGGIAGPLR
jgi:hypothetical protein